MSFLRVIVTVSWGLTLLAVPSAGWPQAAAASNAEAYMAPHATRAPIMAATRAGERIITAGDFGTVLLSDDAGRSWRQARTPTRATLTALYFIDAQRGWAVGHGGVVLSTQDGGEKWVQLSGLDREAVPFAVHFTDAQRGLVVGAFGYAAVTADGGRSWQKTKISRGEYADQHLYNIFAGPKGALWVAAEGGTVFRSVDDGISFEAVPLPYKGSIWGGLVLRDGAVLVWGMRGHVLRSGDGGRTWTDVPSGTQQALTTGLQLAGDEIVIAGLGGAVVRSRDGGRSFAAQIRPERQSHTALVEAGDALITFTLAGIGGGIN
ncbi:MAG: YCF48-related protein [Rhodocyclaceae bacterium]|nr:glycosyl hydrolase [Rhodocyclaceae bacterium]MCO5096385.1 YCF48-related protein [Rhodocyclaceae bacterium]